MVEDKGVEDRKVDGPDLSQETTVRLDATGMMS